MYKNMISTRPILTTPAVMAFIPERLNVPQNQCCINLQISVYLSLIDSFKDLTMTFKLIRNYFVSTEESVL